MKMASHTNTPFRVSSIGLVFCGPPLDAESTRQTGEPFSVDIVNGALFKPQGAQSRAIRKSLAWLFPSNQSVEMHLF